jgi:hypothetical protein
VSPTRSTIRSLAAKGLIAFGLLAAAGGMLTARVLHQGELELRSADALAASGNLEEAVVHARKSASFFAPGAPHVPAAYARLIAVARLAEGRGDTQTALFAWQAVRTSALSTRWVVVPHKDELAVANASIARLSAKQPALHGSATQDPAEVQQKLHMLLARQDQPRMPWVFTLLAGFLALSVGFVHMGWKGFVDKDGFQPSRLRIGALLAAIGTAAWALSLWNA